MYFVSILFSVKRNRYYIEQASDFERRVAHHQSASLKGSLTSSATDWELKLSLSFLAAAKARFSDGFIKTMKSRVFIEKLLEDSDWLTNKFK